MDKRTKTLLLVGAVVLLLVLMNLFFGKSEAGGLTVDNSVTNNNYPTTVTSGVSDEVINELFAMSVATSQHHFDMGTHDWQGSVGAGFYQDENAVSFGVGKRFEQIDALFNASYGQVNDHSVLGAGVTFRF